VEFQVLNQPKRLSQQKPLCGFTLIELLVVIAIIAILAALLPHSLTRMQRLDLSLPQ
jgi:prepilin-type N-terminal cleavage/methylation domain-containing protein